MADFDKPAFYPRVGNRRLAKSPLQQITEQLQAEAQRGPILPEFGDVDLSVPTAANRQMSQRLVEEELRQKQQAQANMSPLERLAAGMQAARMLGSGVVHGIASMPTELTQGPEAAQKQVMERIYQPTIPQAYEHVSDIADILSKLENEYKLPQMIPEAAVLGYIPKELAQAQQRHLTGQAIKKAEQAVAPVVQRTMERGGKGAELMGALTQGSRAHVVNPSDILAAGRALFEQQTPERLAREAEAAEKLAAMPPRSKAAVTEMGLYHPVGGGLKLSKPTWAMHSTTVPDPEFKQPPISIITPEQLVREEAALFPLVGDRAAAGRYLTHVGEKELERPVRLTGGPRYMDANYNPVNPEESAAWESGLGRVTALGRQAERAGEGGRPVYGIYTAGSGTNTDFNVMGANALLQQIPHSKITKKAEKAFDRAMREGTKTSPPIPNWPGIRSPEAEAMILDKSNGIARTKLFEIMGKENFQSMGFPEVPATRKAIIEPELLDIPTNQAGYRLARMDTTGRIIENPAIPSDYPKAMAGQVAGTLDVPADYKDIFQSHFDARRLLGQPESGDYYSFSRAHPIQYADEEWLNRLMEQRFANERRIKEGSYEEGGAVHVSDNPDTQMMEVAGGGAITGAALKAMERLKELKAEAALKSDVWKAKQAADEGKYTQDINAMTPEMMRAEMERMQNPVKKATGGEITADDLILEERPL